MPILSLEGAIKGRQKNWLSPGKALLGAGKQYTLAERKLYAVTDSSSGDYLLFFLSPTESDFVCPTYQSTPYCLQKQYPGKRQQLYRLGLGESAQEDVNHHDATSS